MKQDYKRKFKNYLIFPRFQLMLIIINQVIMTICFGLVFYQVFASFQNLKEIGMKLSFPAESPYFKLIDLHHQEINNYLLVAAIMSYILSFIFTLMFSHKVSGPIYRLKKYFEDMGENGYSNDLSFRDGDYYSEIPSIVNKAISKIKQ